MKLFLSVIISLFMYYTPVSHASGLPNISGLSISSSLLKSIAMKCVRLSRRGTSEVLVNSCGGCRIVAVARKRTGIAMPILRSFNVHPNIPYSLPFKGPGRSRITTIQNCQSSEADARDATRKVGNELGKCVTLKQAVNGAAILVNRCNTCRGAAVQRLSKNGKLIGRQAFKLKSKQTIIVKSKGASQLGLIAEVACPS